MKDQILGAEVWVVLRISKIGICTDGFSSLEKSMYDLANVMPGLQGGWLE